MSHGASNKGGQQAMGDMSRVRIGASSLQPFILDYDTAPLSPPQILLSCFP